MRKILFIDHMPIVGGAQLVLLNYFKSLAKTYELVLITAADASTLATEFENFGKVVKVPMPRLKTSPTSLLSFFRSSFLLYKIFRLEKPDVIATNTERALYLSLFPALLLRLPMVWFVRDFCYNRNLFEILGPSAKHVIFVSKAISDYYKAPKNSEVIYVSSDILDKVSKLTQDDINTYKSEHGLDGKFVVGFLGRLVSWKGYKLLEEVLVKLEEKGVVGLFVGEDELGQIPASFQNIKYIGFSKRPELAYACMNVYVHASVEPEPYATTVVEALFCHTPVLASDLGGTPELIIHEQTGLLFKSGDASSLSYGLSRLISDRQLRDRLADEGFKKVCEENSLEHEIETLKNLFDNI